MRTTYNNGNPITLVQCGCDGCTPATINGKICHEHGCPDAWRDTPKTCYECGFEFYAEGRCDRVCTDCQDGDFEELNIEDFEDDDFDPFADDESESGFDFGGPHGEEW